MEKVRDKGGLSYDVVPSTEKLPDKKVNNKWKWEWLEEQDHGTEKHLMKDYLCKVDVDGVAFCRWCKVTIKYGSTGKKACQNHASNNSDHKRYIELMKGQSQLPSTHQNTAFPTSTVVGDASKEKIVHILDRKSHLEAYILQFICDNNLPLAMAPKLVQFGTVISDDPRAFKGLAKEESNQKDTFSRPTATYKITHGLSRTFQSRIVLALRTTPFSVNIDECTSETGIKVFSIIAMYFDRTIGKSVIQNYKSVSVIKADAEKLASIIIDLFKEDEIPLDNLIADLSDSASTMRGIKSGVEKRLRDVAPHMLSIGGDTCHDMHRCCKAFAVNFGKHVEKFVGDVHNDVKWSVDIKQSLIDICLITGEIFLKPPERTDHRWLSTYDCVVKLLPMMPSLRILYFSFLPSKSVDDNVGKDMYENDFKVLLDEKNITDSGKKAINRINRSMGKKKMTKDGVSRKQRINEKLWEKYDKTLLIMQQYDVIYPMFKSFVLVFEQKTPQIHKLYTKLVEILRQFLSAFMKYELIKKASGSKLKRLEISDKTVRDKADMFYGAKNERLMKQMRKLKRDDIVEEFQSIVKDSYIKCGKYLQAHVPIDEPVLKCLASLNPMSIGDSTNYKYLKQLGDFFSQILNSDEKVDGFLKDVAAIQLDNCLPPAILDEKEVQLDDWWHKVMSSNKYPFLSLVVEACLSVFSGPIVEGTFSILNITMDKQRNRLECETYDGILKCKMYQKSTGKSSSDMYRRKDHLHSPVDLSVCKSMRLAKSRYNKSKAEKKTTFQKKLHTIGGKPTLPRAKKGEKRLKSVHELNNALKDVMKSTAAGKKTKDVSRAALPAKRKQKVVQSSEGGDGGCEVSADAQDLIVNDYIPPKKKKQSDMYSFFGNNQNQCVGSNNDKESEKEIEDADFEKNESSCIEKETYSKEQNEVVKSKIKGDSCNEKGDPKGKDDKDNIMKKRDPKRKKEKNSNKKKIKQTKKILGHNFRKNNVNNLQVLSKDEELRAVVPRYRFNDTSDEEEESNNLSGKAKENDESSTQSRLLKNAKEKIDLTSAEHLPIKKEKIVQSYPITPEGKIYDDLKSLYLSWPSTVEQMFQSYSEELLTLLQSDAPCLQGKDTHGPSMQWMPTEYRQKGFVALESTGNGNCLYNCISIFICGNESQSAFLRMMTSLELHMHAEYYVTHPALVQARVCIPDVIHVEDFIFGGDGAKELENTGDMLAAVKLEAKENTRYFRYAAMIGVMGLASVTQRSIFSVYPDNKHKFLPLLNQEICPRGDNIYDPLHIQWTTMSEKKKGYMFNPNHFVPLIQLEVSVEEP